MNTTTRLAALATAALLAACGGGGGSDGPATTAEGFWVGPTSTGYTARLVVLENGETWGLYSTSTAIVGALYGATNSSSNGTLTGSGSDFYFPGRLLQSATYSGTYTPKSSVRVTTSLGSSFTGAYAMEYDTPAALANVAGSYSGVGITATTAPYATSVSVSSSGSLTATTPLCSGSGTLQPRPSGKGVFNVTITFTGANCPLTAAGTTSGVAVYDAPSRTLVSMGLNPARSNGFFWQGVK